MREPRDAAEWNDELGLAYDADLAAVLRVLANRGEHAVCLLAGELALPYLPWVRDGLSMSSKLIVLLDPDDGLHEPLIQTQLDRDIRIAMHRQQIDDFVADVSEHRVDLVIGAAPPAMMKASAMAVLLGSDAVPEGFFGAPLADGAVLVTRMGIQHGRSRRDRR